MFAVEADDDSLLGLSADARSKAAQASELSHDRDVRGYAALAFASAGDLEKSASVMTGAIRDFPDDHYLSQVMKPMVEAAQYLQKDKPAEAIAVLEAVRSHELGTGPHGAAFVPNHLRGRAYLQLRDGVKAAAEFQRILDHQGVSVRDPLYTLARLNLARSLVLQGDVAKARTAYQDFFAVWKDADPDLPVLKAAKAEYEKLK